MGVAVPCDHDRPRVAWLAMEQWEPEAEGIYLTLRVPAVRRHLLASTKYATSAPGADDPSLPFQLWSVLADAWSYAA